MIRGYRRRSLPRVRNSKCPYERLPIGYCHPQTSRRLQFSPNSAPQWFSQNLGNGEYANFRHISEFFLSFAVARNFPSGDKLQFTQVASLILAAKISATRTCHWIKPKEPLLVGLAWAVDTQG